jgi:hypothetical protein
MEFFTALGVVVFLYVAPFVVISGLCKLADPACSAWRWIAKEIRALPTPQPHPAATWREVPLWVWLLLGPPYALVVVLIMGFWLHFIWTAASAICQAI